MIGKGSTGDTTDRVRDADDREEERGRLFVHSAVHCPGCQVHERDEEAQESDEACEAEDVECQRLEEGELDHRR